MMAQILEPDDGARAAIHHEVGPFVEEVDTGQFEFLGWHEPDGQIPDEGDAEDG